MEFQKRPFVTKLKEDKGQTGMVMTGLDVIIVKNGITNGVVKIQYA